MKLFSMLIMLSVIIVLTLTEIALDCSMFTDSKFIKPLLLVSFIIFFVLHFLKKVSKLIIYIYNLYIISFIYILWHNRVIVNKFIILNENNAIRLIKDDVSVFFIISPKKIQNINTNNTTDDFLYLVKSKIKARLQNEELNIYYDFTKMNIYKRKDMLKFDKFLNSIYFSKFGKKINFFLELPFIKIKNFNYNKINFQYNKNDVDNLDNFKNKIYVGNKEEKINDLRNNNFNENKKKYKSKNTHKMTSENEMYNNTANPILSPKFYNSKTSSRPKLSIPIPPPLPNNSNQNSTSSQNFSIPIPPPLPNNSNQNSTSSQNFSIPIPPPLPNNSNHNSTTGQNFSILSPPSSPNNFTFNPTSLQKNSTPISSSLPSNFSFNHSPSMSNKVVKFKNFKIRKSSDTRNFENDPGKIDFMNELKNKFKEIEENKKNKK